MTSKRADTRTISLLTFVIFLLAFRALAGDPVQAFVDGMYIGFTDDI
jgi:hypothetical protein